MRTAAGLMSLVLLTLGTVAVPSGRLRAAEPTKEQLEFFETHIRPVLAERCYECHSARAEKLKGELRLDALDGLLKGGAHEGPAVVPGDAGKSALLRAIRHADAKLKMPPEGKGDKLADGVIAKFEEWVKMGAPYPPGGGGAAAVPAVDAKKHWAFIPPVDPHAPVVKDTGWAKNGVDPFILAKLEEKGMAPAPAADKRTLIRRAHFDLIGLPPSPEEVEAFVNDTSPDAFGKLIDKLLASRQYGERWGRYWLDVARYADTKGYVFEEERKYPFSYTYRDWVIRAFNEDLPYDQFLIQQIAADRLPLGEDKRPLAAMGFLTLGRRFLNNQPDIIDDRIDVVTRGTMALTVACARCHDHKYDPVPTADYYSLYGVFSSSREPRDLPSIGPAQQAESSDAFAKELAARQAAADALLNAKVAESMKELRSAKSVADHLMGAQFNGTPEEKNYAAGLDFNRFVLRKWTEFINGSKVGHDPVFAVFQAYAAIPLGEFAAKAPAVTEQLFAHPAKPIHPLVAEAFKGKPPATMREVADRYGELIARHSNDQPNPDPSGEALRLVLHGPSSPLNVPQDELPRLLKRDVRGEYMALRRKVDELRANDPGAPAQAMVLEDSPRPSDARILKRGNPETPAEIVPRRFLAILSGPDRQPFADGSGRLELARAIAARDNPLTARVFVNRAWAYHFGHGLVRTPSDFGLRSDPPSHPQLLDWLAVRFVEGGWSVKNLHKLIMLSAAYQQSSDGNPAYAALDPENRLLSHMNRRRLDFEALRDSLVSVTGNLDPAVGGKPVDILDPGNTRRTVYGFVERQNLPGLFRTFDFASPDTHSPQRFFTTVPQQALFMMNSPFAVRQAKALAARADIAGEPDHARRIERLYRLLYARPPEPEEVTAGLAFVEAESVDGAMNGWEKYAQVLLESNEFAFVD